MTSNDKTQVVVRSTDAAAEVRRALNLALDRSRIVTVDLTCVGRLALPLLEVLASAETKARLVGASFRIVCSLSVFRSLVRMGWSDDLLQVSGVARQAA